MEAGRALRDPPDELRQTRMGAQRRDRVIVPGEFGLGECCVDFVMADLVQKDRGSSLAAPKFRDQVVVALAGVRRDRPRAEGADRVGQG